MVVLKELCTGVLWHSRQRPPLTCGLGQQWMAAPAWMAATLPVGNGRRPTSALRSSKGGMPLMRSPVASGRADMVPSACMYAFPQNHPTDWQTCAPNFQVFPANQSVCLFALSSHVGRQTDWLRNVRWFDVMAQPPTGYSEPNITAACASTA
jgi:transposase